MGSAWQSTTSLLAAMCIGAFFVFTHFLGVRQDPREPPLVPATIPYIGHAIGIMREKYNYYIQLSQQISSPIFTMAMAGVKIYVVTTPALIQSVQKQPQRLSFPPVEAKFSSRVCGSSKEAHDILMKNVNGDEGDWGLSTEAYAAMRAALAPGPGLDEMNRLMVRNIASSIDDLSTFGKPIKQNLARWLRDTVTIATTNSVYGPHNPYQDQSIQDAFWNFESDLVTILVGVLNSVLARKGIVGRAEAVKAFEVYFETGCHEKASILTRNRYETMAKYGISNRDIARYEVGNSLAILINTAPAAFWMLSYVFSYPDILKDIREEIGSIQTMATDERGTDVHSLNITDLKTGCPLLTSTFQEVLRHRSVGTSVRQVMQDTVLDGRWVLKKDALVQMPSCLSHTDAKNWGSDVGEFNPRRFVKNGKHKTVDGKRPPAAAFRAFGGGTTLCPGRHFATNEILALVSMLVMRFDMVPTAGTWSMPRTSKTNVASVVMEPDTDIEVEISPRKGFEEVRWVYSLKDSDTSFTIVAEDQVAE